MRFKEHIVPLVLAVVLTVATIVALLIDADARRQRDHRARIFLERGVRLYHKKDYPRAEFELRRALRADREDWKAPFYIGTIHIETKRFSRAIPYFEQALTLNTEEPRILNSLGVVYFNLGRLDLAKGYFAAALEVDPTNGDAKGLMESMAKLQRAAEKGSVGEAKERIGVPFKHN
jgi:Tfp pilus assembly protein PilF